MERVAPVVDETIRALGNKHFVVDPIADSPARSFFAFTARSKTNAIDPIGGIGQPFNRKCLNDRRVLV